MKDIFTILTERVLRDSNGEPICAHVGDIQSCTVKNPPTYQTLRKKVRLGRSKSTASMRLWESVGTLAREGDQEEREKWLIILLDLLTPYFGGWSQELARKWHYEVSDIRSAMVEGALSAWFYKGSGIPSMELLDTMMTRAFASGRGLVEAGSVETCAAREEDSISDAVHEEGFELQVLNY